MSQTRLSKYGKVLKYGIQREYKMNWIHWKAWADFLILKMYLQISFAFK